MMESLLARQVSSSVEPVGKGQITGIIAETIV
jgi:hypothetical protein